MKSLLQPFIGKAGPTMTRSNYLAEGFERGTRSSVQFKVNHSARRGVAAIICLTLSATAIAVDAADTPIPIVDPMQLEALGFPPDAENVYARSEAFQGLLHGDREVDPVDTHTGMYDLQEAKSSGGFGTQDLTYTGLAAPEFSAERPGSATFSKSTNSISCVGTTASTWSYATAQLSLPRGAMLELVNLYAFDGHVDHDATLFVWETCFEGFAGTPSNTLLGSISTVGSNGSQLRILDIEPGVTIGSNRNCSYSARARFSNHQNVCPLESGNEGIFVRHVSAVWRRQISPAPGSATFNDVGTGHPFFQHVEALAASGITAGCGGGNYCPGDPLTRGQMAVFLAAALGLHWP